MSSRARWLCPSFGDTGTGKAPFTAIDLGKVIAGKRDSRRECEGPQPREYEPDQIRSHRDRGHVATDRPLYSWHDIHNQQRNNRRPETRRVVRHPRSTPHELTEEEAHRR